MRKFKNKYRISSTRLQTWNYAWAGAYFVTICTAQREKYFGDILNEKMKLSRVGKIASELWIEIPNHNKNVKLGEFIVMPNHIHGIINLINDNDNKTVETRHALSLQFQIPGQNRFQNQGKNTISSIVGSYKSAVTKLAHKLNLKFKWQPRFYDHVIRNQESYNAISEYIINNPKNWFKDEYYINME